VTTVRPAVAPSRLARRLRTADAVAIGLGSMIGAGVFVAIAPAARVAGAGLLFGLLGAACVAYCNAISSARLAARYPESGGTYAYGRRRLGTFWGYLAGWGFIVGKLASCSAMALTFGYYVAPGFARVLAIGGTLALTAVNLCGIGKTAGVIKAIVTVVLVSLAAFVAAALFGGTVSTGHLSTLSETTPLEVLRSAGLLFFAFAGYARIATLGEEVADPARTIPRAIPIALAITLVVYGIVAVAALLAASPARIADSAAPLRSIIEDGSLAWLSPAIAIGAAVASFGVLLSLLAGVSRTIFAMASESDLPRSLAEVSKRSKVPHRAELAVAAVVIVVVSLADVRQAIGFSSFCVLLYYAIANAAALTLRGGATRVAPAAFGFVGCVALAFALPPSSVITGAIVMGLGTAIYGVRRQRLRLRGRGVTSSGG
jgi:APA family basic amino acid/polyamine antiporter